MARAEELKGLVHEVSPGKNQNEIDPSRYLKASHDAVYNTDTSKYLGYPTLACGNLFIIEIRQNEEEIVGLSGSDYESFIKDVEKGSPFPSFCLRLTQNST